MGKLLASSRYLVLTGVLALLVGALVGSSVMTVKFLEKLAECRDAHEALFFSLAIGVTSTVLIAFGKFKEKE